MAYCLTSVPIKNLSLLRKLTIINYLLSRRKIKVVFLGKVIFELLLDAKAVASQKREAEEKRMHC